MKVKVAVPNSQISKDTLVKEEAVSIEIESEFKAGKSEDERSDAGSSPVIKVYGSRAVTTELVLAADRINP